MPTGTLKKFFAEKGFGFIKADDGSPDLFAPKRTFIGQEETILEGARVDFQSEIEPNTNKPKASSWQITSGGADPAAAQAAAAQAAMAAVSAMPGFGAMGAFGAMQGYGAAMPTFGADPRFMPYGMPAMAGMPTFGAAPAAAGALAPGWETAPDPATGKSYYFNRATGETSWTPPAAAAAACPVAALAAAAAAVPAATPALPAGWEAATDPSSGKQYYFNRATNETTWTVPTA